MYNDNFEQMLKFNKTLNTPLNEWTKTLTDISKRVTDQHLELFGNQYACVSNHLKRLSTVKKPEDLLTLQKELICELITTNIENTQKIMHTAQENLDECAKLWETTLAKSTEKATDKPQKYTEKSEK